jgi:hypothetical protein
MRNSLLIINLICIFSILKVQAQDFWELLPFPDTLDISSVAFNQAGDIFVTTSTQYVTDGVFRSTNYGQTWEVVFTNGTYSVGQVAINDSGHIYLSKDGIGQFLGSYDNGDTWIQKPYPLIVGASRIYCQGFDTLLVASQKDDGVILLRTPDRGTTWDTLFETYNHESESISDIAIAVDGTIYISLMCFIANQGGVYKSTDNGNTWQYVGLINNQVLDVEVNTAGDLYIGVYFGFVGSGGIYVLHNNSSTIDTCLYGPMVNGLVVNPAGHIYAGIGFPNGIIVSKENGTTFEFENSGLPIGPMGQLEIDHHNYIYARPDAPSFGLFRSVDPTFVSINSPVYSANEGLLNIYPNPVSDIARIQLSGKVIPNGNYKMFLYELSSKKALYREVTINDNQFQVHLNHLPCGTYAIQLIVDSGIYSGTLIKL